MLSLREVEKSLGVLTNLQEQRRGFVASGRGSAPEAEEILSEINAQLRSLEWDLNDLQETIGKCEISSMLFLAFVTVFFTLQMS